MDAEGVAAGAQHLRQPSVLQTAGDIESYTGYLFEFLDQLVDNTVPLAKPSVGRSCPWWTPEVQEAVLAARAARHRGGPREAIQAAISQKKSTIRRAKMAQYRRDLHTAATALGGFWRLVRWAKDQSHLPPEPPMIPALKETVNGTTREAVSPQEKAEMLRKHFFPEEPEADLSDVEAHRYPPPVEPLPRVTVEEVQAAMARQRRFSA